MQKKILHVIIKIYKQKKGYFFMIKKKSFLHLFSQPHCCFLVYRTKKNYSILLDISIVFTPKISQSYHQ